MDTLSRAEQEMHVSMDATDRSKWVIYTDDPVWIKRLDKLDYVTETGSTQWGKHYELPATCFNVKKPRKPLTAEQKEAKAKLLREARQKKP